MGEEKQLTQQHFLKDAIWRFGHRPGQGKEYLLVSNVERANEALLDAVSVHDEGDKSSCSTGKLFEEIRPQGKHTHKN